MKLKPNNTIADLEGDTDLVNTEHVERIEIIEIKCDCEPGAGELK